jgi:hypothetical protein
MSVRVTHSMSRCLRMSLIALSFMEIRTSLTMNVVLIIDVFPRHIVVVIVVIIVTRCVVSMHVTMSLMELQLSLHLQVLELALVVLSSRCVGDHLGDVPARARSAQPLMLFLST